MNPITSRTRVSKKLTSASPHARAVQCAFATISLVMFAEKRKTARLPHVRLSAALGFLQKVFPNHGGRICANDTRSSNYEDERCAPCNKKIPKTESRFDSAPTKVSAG